MFSGAIHGTSGSAASAFISNRVDAAFGHGEQVTSTDILGLEDIAWLLRISSYPRGRK